MDYDIKDIDTAGKGKLRVDWASQSMPVLNGIRERFERDRPLRGVRVSACLHITTETANLARALKGGRRIYVLGQGRLINLASAEGHPSSVMDMSFANQALVAEYLASHGHTLEKRVYRVPVEIDRAIAEMKLEAMGVRIDQLTEEQQRYLVSWEQGT